MPETKSKELLFNDLYKNAHTALQSIANLMPELDDEKNKIKEELKEEYERYEKFMSELSHYMRDLKIERKDIGPMKKAMMWSAIKMNTAVDTSDTHVADMMLKGTLNGITDITTMLNGTDGDIPEDVAKYAKELLSVEEENEKRLKKFL